MTEAVGLGRRFRGGLREAVFTLEPERQEPALQRARDRAFQSHGPTGAMTGAETLWADVGQRLGSGQSPRTLEGLGGEKARLHSW